MSIRAAVLPALMQPVTQSKERDDDKTPFKIAQGVALLAFVGIGVKAVLAFHG